jgi:cell division protein FtsL
MYQYGNVAVQYQKVQQQRSNIRPKKQQQPQRNPEPKRFSTLEKITYLLSVILVVAVLGYILSLKASVAQINYEVQVLEKAKADIEEQNAELRLQVAELSSPERILDIAVNQLGLVRKDTPVKILSVGERRNQSRE